MQISTAKESVNKLASAVNTLEHRNIKAIEMVTSERTAEIENTRSIYLATNRKTPGAGARDGLKQAGDRSGLPSLVNIAHCTSEKVLVWMLIIIQAIVLSFVGSWWSSWAIGNETPVSTRIKSSRNSTTRGVSFATT